MVRNIKVDTTPIVIPNEGGQMGFASDWENYMIALEGGWYSGKSFIGARKLLALHEYNAFAPVVNGKDSEEMEATFVPSVNIAPTYGNAMDFCVPHLQDACVEANISYKYHGHGALSGGRYSGPALNLLDMGTKDKPSLILIRTADTPEKITGWSVGAAWGDEPARWREDRLDPKRDAFIQLIGRVRHEAARFIQLMFTYTNEGDATRIYEEMRMGRPGRRVYVSATRENPTAKEFYEQQKLNLTSDLVDQYLEGKAVSLRGGRVYPSFNKSVNVDGGVKIVKGRELHLSLDFNIAPGMHGEIGQYIKEKDIFIVAKELYAPRMSLRALMQKFEEWVAAQGGWQWPILDIYGDATGSSQWAGTGESCYQVIKLSMEKMGFPYKIRVPRSNPPVIDRINAMEVAFVDITGAVHYKIHPGCERLIDDFQNMRRDKFGGIDDTDKKLSHASSAEGYRVHYLRPVRIRQVRTGGRISVA